MPRRPFARPAESPPTLLVEHKGVGFGCAVLGSFGLRLWILRRDAFALVTYPDRVTRHGDLFWRLYMCGEGVMIRKMNWWVCVFDRRRSPNSSARETDTPRLPGHHASLKHPVYQGPERLREQRESAETRDILTFQDGRISGPDPFLAINFSL